MRTDEAKKMTSVSILYPAIIVFFLMVVGLVLTVLEFKKEFNKPQNAAVEQESDQ